MTTLVLTPNRPLEGFEVINLLHSGFNVSSNSDKEQNLVITPQTPIAGNTAIIEASRPLSTPDTVKSISPLFLIAGGIALFLILK